MRLHDRQLARATARAVAACVAACLLSGCGLLSSPTAITQNDPEVLTVTGPDFAQGTVMPTIYTCRGRGESPPVSWSGAPTDTRALALVMDDVDTPITPYVYWIVFNISTQTPDVQAGRLPPGALQARNSEGTVGYSAPCPRSTHQYRFTVYALDAPLRLSEGASLTSVSSAIASQAIGYGRLVATVTR